MDRDDVLARVDLAGLLDVLSPGAPPRSGTGGRWRCVDAGHVDERASVSMFRDHRGVERWRCWSGGHGGTALDAVMLARGVGVREAFDWLADYANVPQPVRSPRREPANARPLGGAPEACVVGYVERCVRWLWSPRGRPVRDWLNDRGLDDDVLLANRVGADPGPQALRRQRGLPCGGVAATFPALDRCGVVLYVQARYLSPPAHRSKYDNPSAALASNPRTAWTQTSTRPDPGVALIVCEGIPDALIATRSGSATVAVLGASFPDGRVADAIIAGSDSRRIVICFDNDTAGTTATQRLLELFRQRGVEADVVVPPAGMDVSDWWRHDPHVVSRSLRTQPAPPLPPLAAMIGSVSTMNRSQLRLRRH